jgi:hypothetical protein
MAKVVAVAIAPRCRNGEHALVDAGWLACVGCCIGANHLRAAWASGLLARVDRSRLANRLRGAGTCRRRSVPADGRLIRRVIGGDPRIFGGEPHLDRMRTPTCCGREQILPETAF